MPTSKLQLMMNEVHIWNARTNAEEVHFRGLLNLLSKDEIKRANKFYFKEDRKRFILARGVLRKILSLYCQKYPNEHKFNFNEYGKPSLYGNDMLCFNISHSGDQILYGVTLGREIGVDVELIKPFEDAEQIVERFFSKQEKAEFHSLPDHLKDEAFFTCWTRKEAYIKAQGKGMSLPLDQFSISFLPGEPARIVETHHDVTEKDRWTLKNITVEAKYLAAAVIEGHDLFFRKFQWTW